MVFEVCECRIPDRRKQIQDGIFEDELARFVQKQSLSGIVEKGGAQGDCALAL